MALGEGRELWEGVDRDLLLLDMQQALECEISALNPTGIKGKLLKNLQVSSKGKEEIPFSRLGIPRGVIENLSAEETYGYNVSSEGEDSDEV